MQQVYNGRRFRSTKWPPPLVFKYRALKRWFLIYLYMNSNQSRRKYFTKTLSNEFFNKITIAFTSVLDFHSFAEFNNGRRRRQRGSKIFRIRSVTVIDGRLLISDDQWTSNKIFKVYFITNRKGKTLSSTYFAHAHCTYSFVKTKIVAKLF